MDANFKHFFLVFLGGGLGATSRFYLSSWANSYFIHKIWTGTFLVNILGCFIFFALNKYASHFDKDIQVLTKVGILGALTTFSTFMAEIVLLIKMQRYFEALVAFLLNVVTGIIIGVGVFR